MNRSIHTVGFALVALLAAGTTWSQDIPYEEVVVPPIQGPLGSIDNVPIPALRFNEQSGARQFQFAAIYSNFEFEHRACAENLTDQVYSVEGVKWTPFMEILAFGRRINYFYMTIFNTIQDLLPFDGDANFEGPSAYCTPRRTVMVPAEFEQGTDEDGNMINVLARRYQIKNLSDKWRGALVYDPNDPANLFVDLRVNAGIVRSDTNDDTNLSESKLDNPVAAARFIIRYYYLVTGGGGS